MKKNGFAVLFLLILVADLLALGGDTSNSFRFATKPAIATSLILYVGFSGLEQGRLKWGLLLGLALFLTGNVVMLFEDSGQQFFITGILVFLAAHLAYAFALYRKHYLRHSKLEPSLIGVTLYILMVFYIIGGQLEGLLPYVILYMMILMIFVLITFLRMPFVNSKSAVKVLSGALLFVISATVFAIDKFAWPQDASEYIVLATYGIGQYLIITGSILEVQPKHQNN